LSQWADSDPEAAALFQEATEDSAEYAAFARAIQILRQPTNNSTVS
jgi:hypothetical protein